MEKAWYFAVRQVINPLIREAERGAGQMIAAIIGLDRDRSRRAMCDH
jgi:hypothetical protein